MNCFISCTAGLTKPQEGSEGGAGQSGTHPEGRPGPRGRRPGVSRQQLSEGMVGAGTARAPSQARGLRSSWEEERPPATTKKRRKAEGGLVECSSCLSHCSSRTQVECTGPAHQCFHIISFHHHCSRRGRSCSTARADNRGLPRLSITELRTSGQMLC